jgi:hypothetical protein
MTAKKPEPTPNDLLPEMSVDELTHILDLYIDIIPTAELSDPCPFSICD